MFSFADHPVSVATAGISHYSEEATTVMDNILKNGQAIAHEMGGAR